MIIDCRNLSVGYGNHTVASNLNFTVDDGDYFCIIGRNGSGKSTLMKTILGLIPPVAGEIELGCGEKQIGYLPQRTDVQKDFPASVFEIVLSGFQGKTGWKPFYSKSQKQEALYRLEQFGMKAFAEKSFRELSGGQQQRVLLARALCAAEKVLLMDEPVSALDTNVSAELYSAIRDLNEKGVSIIMITHDMEAAGKYATKTLSLGFNAESDFSREGKNA